MEGSAAFKESLKKGCNVTNHSIIYWPVNLHFPIDTFFLMEWLLPTLWTKAVLAGAELHLEESLFSSCLHKTIQLESI